MAAKSLPKSGKSSQAATGKSKVISSGPLGKGTVKGGNTKMFGKQSVKASKKR
jgi:hypothetical protein